MEKTFWEKIVLVVTSLRFWLITLAAVGMIFDLKTGNTLNTASVIEVIRNWLIAIAAVGTADSIATRLGGKK